MESVLDAAADARCRRRLNGLCAAWLWIDCFVLGWLGCMELIRVAGFSVVCNIHGWWSFVVHTQLLCCIGPSAPTPDVSNSFGRHSEPGSDGFTMKHASSLEQLAISCLRTHGKNFSRFFGRKLLTLRVGGLEFTYRSYSYCARITVEICTWS